MNRMNQAIAAVIAFAVVAGGLLFWYSQKPTAAPPVAVAPEPRASAALPATAAASEPAIRHPIEAAGGASEPSGPPSIERMLNELFGRKAVQSMFQLDNFPNRFVATVDNLDRSQLSARLRPMNPAAGRFSVQSQGGEAYVSADNGQRYAPQVLLLETVDARQLVAAYKAMYPQLQQAYQELGYPKAYFNDRLVDVIDHLLQTPEPERPPQLRLTEVKGPYKSERPWVRYEYAEPALEALSSGQKTLLRMGVANQRRVKAKLVEIRRLIAASAANPAR